MATNRMLNSRKGQLLPSGQSKAVQIAKLLMSRITGAGSVETSSIRQILFGVDEYAAKIVYNAWKEIGKRHRLEAISTRVQSQVKEYRSQTDPKKKGALAASIEKDIKEFAALFQDDLNGMQQIWAAHCSFLNDLIGYEKNLIQYVDQIKQAGFPESEIPALRGAILRIAIEMKGSSKQELSLAHSIETNSAAIGRLDLRASDALDRVVRRLGYRIDALQKEIKKLSEQLASALKRGDREDTVSALLKTLKILETEWKESHFVGMNVCVLISRLIELQTQFEKLVFYYSQSNPSRSNDIPRLSTSCDKAKRETLTAIRQIAQQVELREEGLPTS